MPNWFETINAKTDPIRREIKSHPFIEKLMDGTLSKEVFRFYIEQDALYLSEYKRVLGALGIKCNDDPDIQFFLSAATGIIEVEQAVHELYLENGPDLGKISPTCELYNSYLSRMVHTRPLEEGLAAVLPCFTIYKEVGDFILANQTNQEENPYQKWIATYGGEEFADSVNEAIAITDKHAETASEETLRRMDAAFEKASRLEWMFWDSAYRKETWPV
ncbi:MAG: thiaminase II [Verrucomicrobiota bacterium]